MLLGSQHSAVLAENVCWSLLRTGGVGRLAISGDSGIEIFPINYLVSGGGVFFRSAPGEKLELLAGGAPVAFEVDGTLAPYHWSVVVHGTATRLDADDEIEASGVMDLRPDHPEPRMWNYVRIAPERLTGRLFRTRGARCPLTC